MGLELAAGEECEAAEDGAEAWPWTEAAKGLGLGASAFLNSIGERGMDVSDSNCGGG